MLEELQPLFVKVFAHFVLRLMCFAQVDNYWQLHIQYTLEYSNVLPTELDAPMEKKTVGCKL